MNDETKKTNSPQISHWQIIILFLSIYVLAAVFVDTIFQLPPETSSLLTTIDNLICLVFIFDFFWNLVTAKNKWAYLKWGWIDAISSVPNLQVFRVGRAARIVRIIRILRGFRSSRIILKHIFENLARGTLMTVAMVCFVMVVFSSIAVLNCETAPESNIKTPSDALWWAFSTITTVVRPASAPMEMTVAAQSTPLAANAVARFAPLPASRSSV